MMEVGQWIRYENEIMQLDLYCGCEQCVIRGFEEPIFKGNHSVYITKQKEWEQILKDSNVTNDPRELIEVGDMVKFSDGDTMIVDMFDETVVTHRFNKMSFVRLLNNITEIWTKTDNDTFKRQWRK